jgi:hypothetical protein
MSVGKVYKPVIAHAFQIVCTKLTASAAEHFYGPERTNKLL